ncbi:hypothetical protein [Nostoc sp.]
MFSSTEILPDLKTLKIAIAIAANNSHKINSATSSPECPSNA